MDDVVALTFAKCLKPTIMAINGSAASLGLTVIFPAVTSTRFGWLATYMLKSPCRSRSAEACGYALM